MASYPTVQLARADRAKVTSDLAAGQGGLVRRDQLRLLGMSRADVRSEVGAGRWTIEGVHTVCVDPRLADASTPWWHAVWETGAEAALDGAASLVAGGLTSYTPEAIDVSVPHAGRSTAVVGVRRHRRRTMPPVIANGVPRVRPECAAIHAAAWARSERQAALLLCLVLQQRLTTPTRLWSVHHDRLRWEISPHDLTGFIRTVLHDICHGAQALGELDLGILCRRRGLPEPDRQQVMTLSGGRVYLDARWRCGLVVEVDGGHHALALNPIDDAVRQNELVLRGERVLRIPVIGLRAQPDVFLDQIDLGLRTLGRLGDA